MAQYSLTVQKCGLKHHSSVCLFVCSFICLFVRSFICLFVRSFISSSVLSFVHSLVDSFICLLLLCFSRYVLISHGENNKMMLPTALEEVLIPQRFPEWEHKWLGPHPHPSLQRLRLPTFPGVSYSPTNVNN